MRLLLDTHALIWWLVDSPKLLQTARIAIADPGNMVPATAVSGYEIANKERLGEAARQAHRHPAADLAQGAHLASHADL